MKRKLPFLFGSMAAMMLSASPVVDRVDFSKKLPVGSAVSTNVENLEKAISKPLVLKETVESLSKKEKFMSNPWYAEDYGYMPYYISFGNFNCGMDAQYRELTNTYILQPAFAPVIYYSLADEMGYTEHLWTYWDPEADSVATSTDPYLMHEYPETILTMPFLTASVDGEYEATYPPYEEGGAQYGAIYGGNLVFDLGEEEPVKFGACNYDLSKDFVYYTYDGTSQFGKGSDAYWETEDLNVKGIINIFEKPASPYLLDGLWINAYNVVASPDATLTMTIYKTNADATTYTEYQGEAIATSTVGIDNIEMVDEGPYFNVHFPIMTVDEDGFETEGGILISDEIMVEITGFNTPEFTSFEPLIQYYDHTSGNNYMLTKFTDLTTNEPIIYAFAMNTSWMVNLSASFPHIHSTGSEGSEEPGDSVCCVPEYGGEFYVTIDEPSPAMTRSSDIEVVPSSEWISYISQSYNETERRHYFLMKAEPLGEGEANEPGEIKFNRNGEEIASVQVVRGTTTGVEDAYAKSITSTFIVDDLQLTYPSDVKKLSIYSATGALVKVVDLDRSGSDVVSMPMAKGVYILSFEGKERAVRKVIK